MTNRFIETFKQDLENGNKYSKCTIDSYTKDIELFFDFLNTQGTLMDRVDDLVIRNYVCEELSNGKDKRSVRRRISALRKFYACMQKVGYVKSNPFVGIETPKTDIKLPKFADDEQMISLINANKKRKNDLVIRDQAILELLYYSGIRAAELVSLTIQNLDLSRNTMRIIGKGNKERIVPFTSEVQKTLKTYLKECRPVLARKQRNLDAAYVFLNSKGNRLTTRGLEYILTEIEMETGMDLGLTPHIVRHSYATNLLTRGSPIMMVKELLGHDSVETTSIYTHVTEETILRNYSLLPRSKKEK